MTAASANRPAPRRTVLHGGSLFDGTGAAPAAADVVLAGGRIVEVGTGLDGDDGVDVSGQTILPGFFDCHVHVTMAGVDVMRRINQPFSYEFFQAGRHLKATLDAGVTTVRDAGGADAGLREAVRDGLIEGPRTLIAITIIGQTGGHSDGLLRSGYDLRLSHPHPGRPSGLADGPDEMRRVVRQVIRAGADVIKVCSTGGVLSPDDNPRHAQFGRDELTVAVAEAEAAGLSVMSHAQGPVGIKNALLAGARSIEHGIYLDDQAIELMLESGAWLVPTLVAPLAVIEAAAGGVQLAPSVVRKAVEVAEAHQDSVRRAALAGVRIAMGTDSGVGPHGDNLRELGLMAECGMRPADVLYAATGSAAELCGLAEVAGRVAPGLAADLVVVDGDPYELTGIADRIAQVWQGGRRVVRTTRTPSAPTATEHTENEEPAHAR
ncbi:amidohydrolase family protein [Streptomyces sp. NBC_01476]|uniref:metal-dependent hydrolase family protein n=1 Tax=Streptomyces sp. NBC_01476 TaxID=2903881 RepID=UPI002E354259|nr:amidohydrolase family protein [Streptomyces sp. NBC_01476]